MLKITSIRYIDTDSIPASTRNTKGTEVVNQLIEKLKDAPAGKSVDFSADGVKKFTRYALQKALQKRGAKVTVSNNTFNGKPSLSVKKLSDAEWKEWMKA